MRLQDIDTPESKILKGGYASRDEQRWNRSGYRHAVHQMLTAGETTASVPRRRKNLKKWCKGKVGREHEMWPIPISEKWPHLLTWEKVSPNQVKYQLFNSTMWFECCLNCGRTESRHEFRNGN